MPKAPVSELEVERVYCLCSFCTGKASDVYKSAGDLVSLPHEGARMDVSVDPFRKHLAALPRDFAMVCIGFSARGPYSHRQLIEGAFPQVPILGDFAGRCAESRCAPGLCFITCQAIGLLIESRC